MKNAVLIRYIVITLSYKLIVLLKLCRHIYYIKQITNEDLLYGRGNYTQYFVMTYKRKEAEKEHSYSSKNLNHCVVHLKLTQRYKSTILQ